MSKVLIFILCGTVFAIQPIVINKSGMNGVSATLFAATTMWFMVLAFSWHSGVSFTGTKWWFVIGATALGTIGLLAYNHVVTTSHATTVGQLLIIPLITQIVVFAGFDAWTNGGLTVTKTIGFCTAILTAILLRPQ